MTEIEYAKLARICDFLFETGILAKIPRSGFSFLGGGDQSVAEHTLRVAFIGYALSTLVHDVDAEKVLKMCLFHDLPEARTSDLNNVSKRYNEPLLEKAIRDLADGLPFGQEVRSLIEEFEAQETQEAIIVRDADQLELILSLKRLRDLGNRRVDQWIPYITDRLESGPAQRLAGAILQTDSDRWWWDDKPQQDRQE